MIQLFPDQKDWARATVDAFEKGVSGIETPTRVLSVAGTGFGKTIVSSAIGQYAIKRWQPHRILFLADSDELVRQAQDKFFDVTGIPTDKEKGTAKASLQSKVIVGSVQTLKNPKRLCRFPQDHFALVVADEAHLSMADGWQRVLNHFDEGGARSLGITGTPFRHDGISLYEWWQYKAAEIGVFELIDLGRLAPIRIVTAPLEIDVTQAEGDGDGEDLDEEALTHAIEPMFEAIIDAWEKYGEGRKTLWFLPGVNASKNFTARLLRRGHAAEHVDGTTKNRAKILERYDQNAFHHLCNADLLMKGYDQPDIECVVILKLTKSMVNYQQMVGRGTRMSPGKKDMMLLDFLFQFSKMGVCRPADLIARNPEQSKRIQRLFGEKSGELIDLRDGRKLEELEAVRRLTESLLANRGRRGESYDARDAAAILNAPELLAYEPQANWEHLPPTASQLGILQRKGVDVGTILTRGQATSMLTLLIGRADQDKATLKQVVALGRRGVRNAHQLTFDEASAMMDTFAR